MRRTYTQLAACAIAITAFCGCASPSSGPTATTNQAAPQAQTVTPDAAQRVPAGQSVANHAQHVASLDRRIHRFTHDLEGGNWIALLDAVPPRILAELAADAGTTVAEMRSGAGEVLGGVMKELGITFTNVKYDLSNANLKPEHITVDGAQKTVLWDWVPISFTVDFGNTPDAPPKQTANNHMWVLLEDGAWYLVRTSEAEQVALVRKLYPFMQGQAIPKETPLQL